MSSDFRSAIGLVVASALLVAALLEPSMFWFGAPALAGGILTAGLIFLTHKRHALSHMEDATDGADMGSSQPMFNMSSVKPTGIGGLALAVMAVFAAVQYPEGRALLAMGVLGGSAVALGLIRLHRPAPETRRR